MLSVPGADGCDQLVDYGGDATVLLHSGARSLSLSCLRVGFKGVPTDSEQVPMPALSQQPVSVAIEADQSSFQYKTGVLSAKC